jgi:hypothetical protein
METKKVLLYTGGALVLGVVGFFVWSFFQKIEIPIGGTTITLGSDDKATDDTTQNLNNNNNNNNSNNETVTQNTGSRNNPFNPNVNNPFQIIEDDYDYSALDKLIYRGV